MRLAAEVTDPKRQEAELEMDERVVALRLGLLDQPALEHEEPGRIGAGGQRIAEALQLGTLFRGLGRQTGGNDGDDQRDGEQRQTRAGGSHQRDPHASHPVGLHHAPAWPAAAGQDSYRRRRDAATDHTRFSGCGHGPRG